ncbi:hypothetical protein Nepgr_013435 [Nepenthes gracilis]|uniref:Uncharacterized protein n=1 Tax=Nepenthes gracilis TaxID=150966 RepID=A0AAD3XP42_NEPGR|nr:hypothetical protein Nepgr_013435 [Nepenthes gracilis]
MLKRNSDFQSGLYSDLDGIVSGLQSFGCPNHSQLLKARRVVVETCILDRMENVGTWIQAKSRRKRKVSPKHSKSSSGPTPVFSA